MPTRDGEELGEAPSGKILRTEENKNANLAFNIHDDKNVAGTGAANDHDVRYTRILEAIAHSASATRENITDKLNQQSDRLNDQFANLRLAMDSGIKSCNDRIQVQEDKLDEFKAHITRELELLQKAKASPEVELGSPSGLTRATSASYLGGPPSKTTDPNFFDPTIVRINSKNIVEHTKIWEVVANILTAANLNEGEVELLPKAPFARGYRVKFTTPGPTATTQAKQLVESLRSGKGPDAVWQEVSIRLPDDITREKVFIGLDRSRSEAAKGRNLKILLDIIKAKLPGQPIAKLNREAAITKSWKSLAELKPHSNYSNKFWQPEAISAKLDQSAIEKEFAENIRQHDQGENPVLQTLSRGRRRQETSCTDWCSPPSSPQRHVCRQLPSSRLRSSFLTLW